MEKKLGPKARQIETENNIRYVLDKFFAGETDRELDEFIRSWIMDDKDCEVKEKAFEESFIREVKESKHVNPSTLDELNSLKARLGLPAADYPVKNGRIAVPKWKGDRVRGGKAKQPPERKRMWLKYAGGAAAVLALGLLITTLVRFSGGKNGADILAVDAGPPWKTVSTMDGSSIILFLPDSTEVRMMGGSELSYPEDFTDKREVRFHGKAVFKVEKDSGKEFTVEMEDARITVLGTEFVAQNFKESGYVSIKLYSGSVAVKTAKGTRVMAPGNSFEYYASDAREPSEVVLGGDWRHGDLEFDLFSMDAMLDVVERRYQMDIERNGYNNETRYIITIPEKSQLSMVIGALSRLAGDFDYEITDNVIELTPKKR